MTSHPAWMARTTRSGAAELWFGHFSLRHVDIDERWPAVAEAGFTGVSVLYSEVLRLRAAGTTAAALRSRAESLGLRLPELEFFRLASKRPRAAVAELAADMARTAAELGCESITSVGLSDDGFVAPAPAGAPVDGEIVQRLEVLADACAREGIGCTVEFMPFVTAVDTLERAVSLLHAAARPNVGLTLDAIHFFRAGPDWPGLAALDPGLIHTVQLCDGSEPAPAGPYSKESLELRMCPGEGQFDLRRFVSALDQCRRPFTVEVLSRELSALPAAQAACRMAESTRKLVAATVAADGATGGMDDVEGVA